MKRRERNITALSRSFIDNPTGDTFRPLIERMTWGLRKHIYKITQDNDATDEVLLRTFEDIWTKHSQFDSERGQFSSWAYGIAKNNSLLYMQELASKRRRQMNVDLSDMFDSSYGNVETLHDTPSINDSSSESVSYIEEYDSLYEDGKFVDINKDTLIDDMADASIKCIDYLPDNYRLVLKEQLVRKKKIDQIAAENKIPMTTVVNWLYKGKIKLQDVIKDKYSTLYESYRLYYPECGKKKKEREAVCR